MAKTKIKDLIDSLAELLGDNGADAPTRLALLAALQRAENAIAQAGSYLFLHLETTIDLLNNASSAALPSGIDPGKMITLSKPNNRGELPVVPPDRFRSEPIETYGVWACTTPSCAKIGIDSNGAFTVYFTRPGSGSANISGATITYKLAAQKLPNTLADDANSVSSVPEGYENTVLLKRAYYDEAQWRGMAVDEAMRQRDEAKEKEFFDAFRTSREVPMPDGEQQARSVSKKIHEGAGA